jgi:hypothetical protein
MIVKFTDIGRLFILRLRMRSQILKALLLATTLSYIPACAQDPNQVQAITRDAKGVDASAHAGVDEETLRVPQPSQQPAKPATTYSRWGITASGQPPATQYWPAHAGSPTSTDTSTDRKSTLPRTKPPLQTGSKPLPSAISSAPAGINSSTGTQRESSGTSFSSTSPSFQAGGKSALSTSWSTHPGDALRDSANTGNSESAVPQPNISDSSAATLAQNGPANSQRAKPALAPLSKPADGFSSPFSPAGQADGFSSPFSRQRQSDGFSSPFSTNQSESNVANRSLSQPFSQANSSWKRNRGRTIKPEHTSQKTLAASHAAADARFHSKSAKPVGAGPAAKTD